MVNMIYYVYSRPTWVLSQLFILTGLFTRHCGFVTNFLSLTMFRVTAKCVPIACLIVIFVIQLLFCGDSIPLGTYLTFPCALLFGLGFNLCALSLSTLIGLTFEFPFIRFGQVSFISALIHDERLRMWHSNVKAKGLDNDHESVLRDHLRDKSNSIA